MYRIPWLAIILLPALLRAQPQTFEKQGGNFSVGARTTFSTFGHGDPKSFGYGAGAHFRLQVIDRVNTEWYADVISSNIKNKAHRMDYHIGWSVMYYLLDPKAFTRKFTPYVVMGHCFDETYVRLNGPDAPAGQKRFSSAVHAGIGCHYNITPKFDISLTTQYMLHLGKELHAHEEEDGSILIETHQNAGWEGHLLISISFNYKIARLWKAKKRV